MCFSNIFNDFVGREIWKNTANTKMGKCMKYSVDKACVHLIMYRFIFIICIFLVLHLQVLSRKNKTSSQKLSFHVFIKVHTFFSINYTYSFDVERFA